MKSINLITLSSLIFISNLAQSNDITVEYKNQGVSINSINNVKKEIKIQDLSIDTTALWYYINNNQQSLAKEELTRLKTLSPFWKPTKVLIDTYKKLVHSPQASKPKIANKSNSIFEKIVNISNKKWREIPNKQFNKASILALKNRNADNNNLMGWISINRNEYLKAIEHFNMVKLSTPQNTSANDGLLVAISGLVKQAIEDENTLSLTEMISDYSNQPILQQIESQAWAYDKQEKFSKALRWFEFTGNYDAQIIELEKLSHKKQAIELACAHTSQSSLQLYCINAYAAKQLKYFNQKKYPLSLQASAKIKQYQALNKDQLILYAWAQYHLFNKVESITAFKQLINQDPNNESYINAIIHLSGIDSETVKKLSKIYPKIAIALNDSKKKSAWDHKQFDLYSEVDNQETQLTIEAGIDWRNQYSQSELADLNTANYFVGFSKYRDQYRYGARVNYQTTQSEPLQNYLTEASATELKGYIKRQSTNLNTLAELEYSLPSNDLEPIISGKLSTVWFTSPKLLTAASLYRARVNDSFLSFMGTYQDGKSPSGGVTETGARGLISYTFQPYWSVGTELNSAYIKGNNVDDNSKVGLQVNLTRTLPNLYPTQLDHLRIGPNFSWTKYNKNLSGYDDSDGRYFSPQRYINLGGTAELLTLENKNWQLRSQLGIGYYWTQTDPDENSDSDESSYDNGLGSQLLLEAQWLISSHWEIAGLISSNNSADYNEINLGLNIRCNFEAKSTLTSDTLISSSPYNTNYAWH